MAVKMKKKENMKELCVFSFLGVFWFMPYIAYNNVQRGPYCLIADPPQLRW